ncbi:MAG: aminotransferase class V-fold PLP-dependent enzyme [Gemmatimonadota bacterium]|nr:MAG: aminotransferase class V-fold PLP-dependent enzyme [Gemmatimonadota bacterium]
MPMHRFADDFGPFEGRVWLNCAHQGSLPHVSVRAASEALRWKMTPSLFNDDSFNTVPQRLKRALGQLVGAPAEEIILGNSTSYGIHLLANGIPWRAEDEVLLVTGDFPANILPWLALEERDVQIRFIEPSGSVPKAEEVAGQITPATRLFCTSWVNPFSGHAIDVQAVGAVCRAHNVVFVLNGSQALGARFLDVALSPVDALSCCGFKWLCGPYGTGFCWMKPELRESLEYNQAYWLAMQSKSGLERMRDYCLRDDLGASQYDDFCTANFMNFLPWTASVEYLLAQGLERIQICDEILISRLIDGLDRTTYDMVSPTEENARSTLFVFTHKEPERNPSIFEVLRQEGIDISLREGNLRVSPHLYNTIEDIDRLLSILHSISGTR